MEIIRRSRRGLSFPLQLTEGFYLIDGEVKQAPLTVNKVIAYDNFDRSDGPLGNAVTGQTWESPVPGIEIVGGLAANPTGSSNVLSVVETGLSDCIITVKIAVVKPGTRIAFRTSTASNFYTFQTENGHYRLYKFVNGSATMIGNNNLYSPNATDEILRVVLKGSSIKCYANGNLIFDVVDDFNKGATKHGIRISTSEARISEFLVLEG